MLWKHNVTSITANVPSWLDRCKNSLHPLVEHIESETWAKCLGARFFILSDLMQCRVNCLAIKMKKESERRWVSCVMSTNARNANDQRITWWNVKGIEQLKPQLKNAVRQTVMVRWNWCGISRLKRACNYWFSNPFVQSWLCVRLSRLTTKELCKCAAFFYFALRTAPNSQRYARTQLIRGLVFGVVLNMKSSAGVAL